MTKRDFELIASVFALETKEEEQGRALAKMRWIATGLATKFSAENPRFDRERFLKACGVN